MGSILHPNRAGRRAGDEAQAAEDERIQKIKDTQGRISDIFGSPERESQIQDFIDASRTSSQQDLGRTRDDVARNLKFSLARSGNVGGSVQIDQNRNLTDDFLRASLDSERRVQGAGSRLRSSDQQSKLSLFNQALGGLDLTTSAQNASSALSTNIGAAKAEGTERNFDSFFSDFGSLFTASKEAEGRRQQQRDFRTLFPGRG